MKKFYTRVVALRKWIFGLFLLVAVFCALCQPLVAVNYDMNDYLPEDAASTKALDLMDEEFDGGIPNARVMVRNVTIPEALQYKEQIANVDGVTDVTWLDDSVDVTLPLSSIDTDVLKNYYVDNTALFSVTIAEESRLTAIDDIRSIVGDDNAISGSAASTAAATKNTVAEIQKISVIAVLFVLLVLVLTTTSFAEPIFVLFSLGVAILINAGSNLIFGEISFVTNAAGNILQLAVSLDYSVFLIQRFTECRQTTTNVEEAMVDALCKSTTSILSSGLTTVIGFLALIFMRFRIGSDLGMALAKGVAISLITVFFFTPSLVILFYPLLDKTKHRPFVPSMQRFGRLIQKVTIPFVVVFLVIIAPVYLASKANSYYYGSSHIFNETTQLGRDTDAINETFGQNDTYVVLVPRGDTATEVKLSDALHELDHVTDIISYVDTVGAQIPTEYLDASTLSKLESDNYSRMVLQVDVPYEGDETFSLINQIRDVLQDYYPDSWYLAGEGVSTCDLMETVTADMTKVNFIAIAAVFVILLLMMHSVLLPVILVISIESAIWINLSCPYFSGNTIFYIAYLIISSIQLGATVDYAILMTERYKENRQTLSAKESIGRTVSNVTVSVLTSGSALAVVGLLLGYISSNQLLAQLGIFIGRGAIFSLIIVLFVLPGFLYLSDRFTNHKKARHATTAGKKQHRGVGHNLPAKAES